MRTGQVPGKPDVSTACWAAALECLRAGASTPQIVGALRVTGPARAQLAIRLKKAKSAINCDPGLSAVEQLAELRRLRCAELEDPIVDAAQRYAQAMSTALDELRTLYTRRQTLAANLQAVNQQVRAVRKFGIGERNSVVTQHNSLVSELEALCTAIAATLNRFEPIHAEFTTLCDRGLLRSGHTVKDVLDLGGVPRGQSTVYRIHKREHAAHPSEWEFRFSATLLELLPRVKAGHEALVEARQAIAADQACLRRPPGETDLQPD